MDEQEMKELLARNLQAVRARIQAAAERAHRDPAAITLVAVSKTVEPARIAAAYQLGLRHFGENRVEEAETKIPAISPDMPGATWHMIGHLQSRKAPRAAQLFDLIHSVDSVHLAERLESAGCRQRQKAAHSARAEHIGRREQIRVSSGIVWRDERASARFCPGSARDRRP